MIQLFLEEVDVFQFLLAWTDNICHWNYTSIRKLSHGNIVFLKRWEKKWCSFLGIHENNCCLLVQLTTIALDSSKLQHINKEKDVQGVSTQRVKMCWRWNKNKRKSGCLGHPLLYFPLLLWPFLSLNFILLLWLDVIQLSTKDLRLKCKDQVQRPHSTHRDRTVIK